MSNEGRSIWDMMTSFYRLMTWNQIRLLVPNVYPKHNIDDSAGKQLSAFEDALSLPYPRLP